MKGLVLEFGVYRGFSIKQLSERYPDRTIYGFDSFEGNDVPWCGYAVGGMRTNRPEDLPSNVELIVGRVEHTLLPFLKENPGPIEFIHLDLDLYEPTKFVLNAVKDRISTNTVILFDDYWGYSEADSCERKAFSEYLHEHKYVGVQISDRSFYINRSLGKFGLLDFMRIALKFWRIPRLIMDRLTHQDPPQAFRIEGIG